MSEPTQETITSPVLINDEAVQKGFDVIKQTSWKEKLKPESSLPLVDVVESIWIGEQTGQIDLQQDQSLVNDAIRRGFEYERTNEQAHKKEDEDNAHTLQKRIVSQEEKGLTVNQGDRNRMASSLSMAQYYGRCVVAYENELKQFAQNENYGVEWFLRQKSIIESARNEVIGEAKSTDEKILELLGEFRDPNRPVVPVQKRTVVLSQEQYLQFQRTMSEANAIENAYMSAGYATFPEAGKPRTAVVKFVMQPDISDNQKIAMRVNIASGTVAIRHEALHLITDGSREAETITTNTGKRILDRRGFLSFVMTEGGKIDFGQQWKYRSEDTIPEMMMEEGCVTFLQKYLVCDGDLDKIYEALNEPNFDTNTGYIEAAKEFLRLVEIFGIEPLARAYVNSDPQIWLDTIADGLGVVAKTEHIRKLKGLDSQRKINYD